MRGSGANWRMALIGIVWILLKCGDSVNICDPEATQFSVKSGDDVTIVIPSDSFRKNMVQSCSCEFITNDLRNFQVEIELETMETPGPSLEQTGCDAKLAMHTNSVGRPREDLSKIEVFCLPTGARKTRLYSHLVVASLTMTYTKNWTMSRGSEQFLITMKLNMTSGQDATVVCEDDFVMESRIRSPRSTATTVPEPNQDEPFIVAFEEFNSTAFNSIAFNSIAFNSSVFNSSEFNVTDFHSVADDTGFDMIYVIIGMVILPVVLIVVVSVGLIMSFYIRRLHIQTLNSVTPTDGTQMVSIISIRDIFSLSGNTNRQPDRPPGESSIDAPCPPVYSEIIYSDAAARETGDQSTDNSLQLKQTYGYAPMSSPTSCTPLSLSPRTPSSRPPNTPLPKPPGTPSSKARNTPLSPRPRIKNVSKQSHKSPNAKMLSFTSSKPPGTPSSKPPSTPLPTPRPTKKLSKPPNIPLPTPPGTPSSKPPNNKLSPRPTKRFSKAPKRQMSEPLSAQFSKSSRAQFSERSSTPLPKLSRAQSSKPPSIQLSALPNIPTNPPLMYATLPNRWSEHTYSNVPKSRDPPTDSTSAPYLGDGWTTLQQLPSSGKAARKRWDFQLLHATFDCIDDGTYIFARGEEGADDTACDDGDAKTNEYINSVELLANKSDSAEKNARMYVNVDELRRHHRERRNMDSVSRYQLTQCHDVDGEWNV